MKPKKLFQVTDLRTNTVAFFLGEEAYFSGKRQAQIARDKLLADTSYTDTPPFVVSRGPDHPKGKGQ